jgi:hypothetical protein
MSTEAISPLRQRMIEDMNARKLCAGTQRVRIPTQSGHRFQRKAGRIPIEGGHR